MAGRIQENDRGNIHALRIIVQKNGSSVHDMLGTDRGRDFLTVLVSDMTFLAHVHLCTNDTPAVYLEKEAFVFWAWQPD